MKRILIIGTSGSGKSTLAQRLSERLRIPFIPTDSFYWEQNWKVTSTDKVHKQVTNVIANDAWILDGNFDEFHQYIWQQADCIIWLDYPLPIVLKQVIARNLHWLLTRQKIWSGNIMTTSRAISGIGHAVKSHSLKRANYPSWLAELHDIQTHRFSSHYQTEQWFQNLSQYSYNQ